MAVDGSSFSTAAQHLFEAALRLPDTERAQLADRLYSSIEAADRGQLFEQTIARRAAEIESGTARLHTWDDLQQIMQDALHAARNI